MFCGLGQVLPGVGSVIYHGGVAPASVNLLIELGVLPCSPVLQIHLAPAGLIGFSLIAAGGAAAAGYGRHEAPFVMAARRRAFLRVFSRPTNTEWPCSTI